MSDGADSKKTPNTLEVPLARRHTLSVPEAAAAAAEAYVNGDVAPRRSIVTLNMNGARGGGGGGGGGGSRRQLLSIYARRSEEPDADELGCSIGTKMTEC